MAICSVQIDVIWIYGDHEVLKGTCTNHLLYEVAIDSRIITIALRRHAASALAILFLKWASVKNCSSCCCSYQSHYHCYSLACSTSLHRTHWETLQVIRHECLLPRLYQHPSPRFGLHVVRCLVGVQSPTRSDSVLTHSEPLGYYSQ